jgi:hypothetical protein
MSLSIIMASLKAIQMLDSEGVQDLCGLIMDHFRDLKSMTLPELEEMIGGLLPSYVPNELSDTDVSEMCATIFSGLVSSGAVAGAVVSHTSSDSDNSSDVSVAAASTITEKSGCNFVMNFAT